MKICIISDTHKKHWGLLLPDADMIIHCGDFTSRGKEQEVVDFMDWFSGLDQFKYKICIAGNHDWIFDAQQSLAKTLIPENVIYLEDSGIEIEGLKFYGTPVQKPFFNWAFNRVEEKLKDHWGAIPNDTDVLITHTAPLSILDFSTYGNSHEGSPTLYDEVIDRIKPLVNTFGHFHTSRGSVVLNGTTFINASVLNDNYDLVYEPMLIEIIDRKVYVLNIDRPYKHLFD